MNRDKAFNNTPNDSKIWFPILVTVSLCLLLTVIINVIVDNSEDLDLVNRLESTSSSYESAIIQELDQVTAELQALVRHFQRSSYISRSEFNKIVEPILHDYPEFQAIEWIPEVKHSERKLFISEAIKDGLKDYEFYIKDSKGEFAVSPEKSVYYPVYYLAPLKGNKSALGYDLGSSENRKIALQQAKDNDAPVLSSAVKLVQNLKDEKAVLLFLPISEYTENSLKIKFKGFILGVFRINSVVTSALKKIADSNINYSLHDISNDSELLFEPEYNTTHFDEIKNKKITKFLVEKEFNFSGRQWRIEVWPTSEYIDHYHSKTSNIILIIGVLFSIAFGILLYLFLRRLVNTQLLINQQSEELASKTEEYQTLLDTMNEAMIVIDGVGTILSVNPATLNLFSFEEEDLVGNNVNILMPREIATVHNKLVQNAKLNGIKSVIGKTREIQAVKKDGSMFPMELSISEMVVGDSIRYAGVIRDVSERKIAEQVKEEFFSVVTHELRTPITSIRGALGLVVGGALGETNQKIHDLLSTATNNCDRLIRLVNDILDLSKIESGKMELSLESVEINALLTKSIEENTQYAQKCNVEFLLVGQIPSIAVYVDEGRLIQVMSNLLSNAAKYSAEGSQIEVSVIESDNEVTVSVHDKGPGIPDDFIAHLFDKYSQSDKQKSKKIASTGLGLNIARNIIEQHHGTIHCENHRDGGAVFYFTLPVYQQEAA